MADNNLADIEMPVMGGLECAREIRKRAIDIPICAVTANAREAQLQQVCHSRNTLRV